MSDFEMPYFLDGGGNKGYFKDSTARDQIGDLSQTGVTGDDAAEQIETLKNLKCEGGNTTAIKASITSQMDDLKAAGKSGVFPFYISSGNDDFPTTGYCMAIGAIRNGGVSTITAVNSQTGDIWTNGNVSQAAGAWTGWKKVRSGYSKQTLTTTDYPLLYSNLILIRSGSVVSILFRGFKNLTANAENTIISALPTEFRPSEEIHHVIFQGGNSAAMARISISSGGVVKIWPYGEAAAAGSTNMISTLTYVI